VIAARLKKPRYEATASSVLGVSGIGSGSGAGVGSGTGSGVGVVALLEISAKLSPSL